MPPSVNPMSTAEKSSRTNRHAARRWRRRNAARRGPGQGLLPSQTRRVRVEKERTPLVVARAANDAGGWIPKHVGAWRRGVLEVLDLSTMRTDRRNNLVALITYLASRQDPASRTVLTTWEAITAATGLARRTVARLLRVLRDHRLLSVVATGRSAGHTPASTGRTRGEAPVYGLILPHKKPVAVDGEHQAHARYSPTSETVAVGGVDENGTPDPEGLDNYPCAGAREPWTEAETASPSPSLRRPATPAATLALLAQRKDPLWPTHATVAGTRLVGVISQRKATREAERRAAGELQWQVPVLRAITPDHLASTLRPFFRAGWSIRDVAHALDVRPDGTQWPHSGATGVRHLPGWIRHRLTAWTRDGRPVRSFGQRGRAAAEQRAAERRAETARRAAHEAERATIRAQRQADPRSWRERFATEYEAGKQAAAAEARALTEQRRRDNDARQARREQRARMKAQTMTTTD